MERMEQFGVPRQIVAFVMPTGYSFNLDGIDALPLARLGLRRAGRRHPALASASSSLMVLTLMLTSKGVAGVPRASLVILLGTLPRFDLPSEPIFLILGIDELMDMARTSVNVIGNCLATVVVGEVGRRVRAWRNPVARGNQGSSGAVGAERGGYLADMAVPADAVGLLLPHSQMFLAKVSDGAFAPDFHEVVVQSLRRSPN